MEELSEGNRGKLDSGVLPLRNSEISHLRHSRVENPGVFYIILIFFKIVGYFL
jgi:hypothetical protein